MALKQTLPISFNDRVTAIENAVKGDGLLCVDFDNGIYVMTGSGSPIDGTTGKDVCGKGSEYVDLGSGNKYVNLGTKASPAWVLGSGSQRDMTYAGLVAAIGSASLVPGETIRITDFTTVHYIIDAGLTKYPTIITGSIEPLLISALTTSSISSIVRSESYPQDIIAYEWNPTVILNDLAFGNAYIDEGYVFHPGTAPVPGFKGAITLRRDTIRDNSAGYDFRACKMRRWKTGVADYNAEASYQKGDWVKYNNLIWRALRDVSGVTPVSLNDNWTPVINLARSEYVMPLPIALVGFFPIGKDLPADETQYIDVLTFQPGAGDATYDRQVRNINLKPAYDDLESYSYGGSRITNNVFYINEDPYGFPGLFSVELAAGCFGNTFSDVSSDIVFAGAVTSCIFGSVKRSSIKSGYAVVAIQMTGCHADTDFSVNVFGANCNNNTFGAACIGNTHGSDFENNQIGASVAYMMTAHRCRENVFESRCSGDSEADALDAKSDFRRNKLRAGIGVSAADFSSSNHVYADYNCEILSTPDGTKKLIYVANDGTITVVAFDA